MFGQQTINGTLQHDGLTRSYILYVPASYTPGTAAPLVLNFHGYTSNAFEQMFYGDFRAIADTAGFFWCILWEHLTLQARTIGIRGGVEQWTILVSPVH